MPGAWLSGELQTWRSIMRRRPVAWTLLGVALVAFVLLPGGWLARTWYLTRCDRLHRAVYAGDVEEVRRLLAAGADVNQPSRTGMNLDTVASVSTNSKGQTVIVGPPRVEVEIGGITLFESPEWPCGDTPLQIAVWYAPDTPGLIALLATEGGRYQRGTG